MGYILWGYTYIWDIHYGDIYIYIYGEIKKGNKTVPIVYYNYLMTLYHLKSYTPKLCNL